MKKEIIVMACIFFIVLANSFSIITNNVFYRNALDRF